MNKLPKRKFGALLSLAAMTSLTAVTGYAQTPAPSNQKPVTDEPRVLETYTVTGSYLPAAANAVAIPVTSIDTAAIERSGNNNSVLEILRKTMPQFSGNGNIGSSNANVSSGSTQGGSQVSLRNTSTLVLINGRRAAYSPADAQGGYQFVDVNLIPVAAIEKIEVLADGASAIYGSDAVGGVVNIILKTNYEGFEAGGRYGWSTNQGHQAERSAYVVGGVGNEKTHVTISSEWVKNDPIYNYERPYSAVTYGTPTFAGSVNVGSAYYYLSPSLNAPTVTTGGVSAATLVANGTYSGPRVQGDQFQFFNLSQYVTQTTENQRKSFSLAIDHKLAPNLTAFGDVLYSQTNTFSQINGQPINSSALASMSADGVHVGLGGSTIPAGLYGNPFNVAVTARNRLVNHPREYLNDTAGIRGVAGLKGDFSEDWHFETAATYNRIVQDYSNPGVINNKALAWAVVTGQFNFFARSQAPGVLESTGIVGTATGQFVSTLRNLDATVSGHLFDLPAGPLDIAFRAEQRKEMLSGTADPNSQLDPVTGQLGWNGATTLYPFDASRSVGAIAGEIRVPVVKNLPGAHLLEVTGALRHEFYSDTENPTVPKISARYLPFNDEFALRGTYGKSFSAPQLYSLFGPVSIGFTDPFTLTTVSGGTIANLQTNSESGANPNLKPSRSENYTVGFVYSPKAVKGLSLSVDYWHIRQTQLVSSIPTSTLLQDVELKGAASQYANTVHFGSFTGPTATKAGMISSGVGDDIYVIATNINIAQQKLDGFDIKADYDWKVDGVGRFSVGSNVGIYNHYTHVDIPGDPAVDTVAKSTAYNGTIPRWQSYTTFDFNRDAYGVSLGWRSIPRVMDVEEGGGQVASFNSFDGSVSYEFNRKWKYVSGAKLTLGCTNIFNRFGPLDPTVNSDSNVDTATYGAMGRFVYVDVKFKF